MALGLGAALLSFTAPQSLAQGVMVPSTLAVPGKQVGVIKKGMTVADLKKVLGAKAVKTVQVSMGEGDTTKGYKVYAGTDKELEIVPAPDDKKEMIGDVRLIGKAWKFESGLKVGSTLLEVEKINGKPFKVWGFEWDLGGWADFTGGSLEGLVSVRFGTKGDTTDESIVGDKQISSTDKKLRAAKPEVSDITVILR